MTVGCVGGAVIAVTLDKHTTRFVQTAVRPSVRRSALDVLLFVDFLRGDMLCVKVFQFFMLYSSTFFLFFLWGGGGGGIIFSVWREW